MPASHTISVLPQWQFLVFAKQIPLPSAKNAPAPFFMRDVIYGGAGIIYGTVAEKGTPTNIPLRRRVLLLQEGRNKVIRAMWSDQVTGEYVFRAVDEKYKYTSLAYDYENNYRAVAADNQTPEVAP